MITYRPLSIFSGSPFSPRAGGAAQNELETLDQVVAAGAELNVSHSSNDLCSPAGESAVRMCTFTFNQQEEKQGHSNIWLLPQFVSREHDMELSAPSLSLSLMQTHTHTHTHKLKITLITLIHFTFKEVIFYEKSESYL